MDVHLRALRYFLAVAERLHFTQAAEELHVSQPALSKQVRALESQLGTPLFTRGPGRVALTDAGRDLVAGAQRAVTAWQEAERDLRRGIAGRERSLVVGFSTAIGRGLVPALRARLAVVAPHLTVTLRQVGWADPTGGLRPEDGPRGDGPRGDGPPTDAAFVWLPVPATAALGVLVVATEPRCVALPRTHRLATRAEITVADLLDEPFVALPEEAGALRDHWLAADARGTRPVVVGAVAASTEETFEAVNAGLGLCLVAEGNAGLLEREGVTVRPVQGLAPSRLALAWRREDTREALRNLCTAVQQVVR
jgi:DNA-binding transcriptional LysR family regulator